MREAIVDKIAIAMRRRGETIKSIMLGTGFAFETVSKIVKTGSANMDKVEKVLKHLKINIEIK